MSEKINVLGGYVALDGSIQPAGARAAGAGQGDQAPEALSTPAGGSARVVARFSPDEIAVRHSVRPDVGLEFLSFDVPNGWDDVKKVSKKALLFDKRKFTFAGWNSDDMTCTFSRALDPSIPEPVAKIVRRK